jgi:hypothetical protein
MTNKKLVRKVKLNKAIKILLWIFGIVLGIFLISIIGFKIWMSTWQTYKSDEFGFSLKIPNGWDIQDPRKDKSDTQFVFDYGSILKFGDGDTNFPKDSNGNYSYMGNILTYIYSDIPDKLIGLNVVMEGTNGIDKDYIYGNSNKAFMISVRSYNDDKLLTKLKSKIIESLIANSFSIIK